MYIGDTLARRCVYTPDKLAFVDVGSGARLTFAQMNDRANRLANWLAERGIRKNDRVGIVAHNSAFYFDLFFACGKLGAILTPFNWRLHPREIEALIRQVTPAILFMGIDPPIDVIADHLRGAASMPVLIPFEGGEGDSFLAGWEAASSKPVTCESITEIDAACLLFTGGTTGLPKAVQISHRQIIWNTLNDFMADVLHTDTYLNVFPLFHTGGLFSFSTPMLILGGTVIQPRVVNPGEILRLIEAEYVTVFAGVPTVFQMMADAPEWKSADLSSLRYCLSGGAPMPVPLIRRYREEKNIVFRQGFGMTEFGPSVFSLPAEDAERKVGSIGKPNFFVDARVVDPDTNQPLGPHEVGELALRSPVATTGYFGNPDANAKVFDEEGYFHTGDAAKVDEEGYFFIVDRLKDMFISGGENVYPTEVEAALYTHPAVRMCAVVGMLDPKWGEVGCAFVVRKDTALDITPDALIVHLRGLLARYKVPKQVIFVDALPISGVGKVMKNDLRKMALDTQAGIN